MSDFQELVQVSQSAIQVDSITLLAKIQEFNLIRTPRQKEDDTLQLLRGLSDRRCRTSNSSIKEQQILLLCRIVNYINYRESKRSFMLTIVWPFLALAQLEEPLFFSRSQASPSLAVHF